MTRVGRVEWAEGRWVPLEVAGEGGPVILLAHGAGSHMAHPSMVVLRDALVAAGATVATFDYPYRAEGGDGRAGGRNRAEGGDGRAGSRNRAEGRDGRAGGPNRADGGGSRKPPDRMPVLQQAHRAVLDRVRSELSSEVVLAGRSMGGRVGTHLAAEGAPCLGVVAFAYPLHPPGRPDRLRVEHLPLVTVPMLFFQGSRDPLSRSDLFDLHVRPLPGVTVVDLAGANHSLRVPGVGPEEVHRDVAAATLAWIGGLSRPGPRRGR